MADVVFIVGAGASVHAEAPVMSNFLDRARELLAAGKVDDRKSEFETAFKVISYLQRVHSKARLDHNNIESVFSAVDLARTIKKLPGINPEQIDGALKSLIWLIVRTLEESIQLDSSGGRYHGTGEYRQLARLIRELHGRRPPLSSAVVTFNYDVAMDLSFAVEGVPFSYCLNGADPNTIPLLKLHGSLNWWRSKDKDRSIIPYSMLSYRNDYSLQHWMPGDAEPKVVAPITKHGLEQLRRQLKTVEDEPVIVPPTWSKGEYHRDIASVWSRAAREFSEARHIFVLGYSLPETDQFFRLLFGLGTEGESVISRMTVFDPDVVAVKKRFRAMLGPGVLDRFKALAHPFGTGLGIIEGWLFEGAKRARD